MSARTKAYLFLLIAVAIWGVAGPIIKLTLAYFDPIVFLVYRFFISSLILIPLVRILHPHIVRTMAEFTPADWLIHFLTAFFSTTLQLSLLFWGFSLTTSLDATLISSTSPILVSVAGGLFLHEHLSHKKKLGLLISFIGSAIIILQPILATNKLFSGNLWGNLLVVLANLAWVVGIVLTKKELRHHISPLFLTANMFFVGFITLAIFLVLTHDPYTIVREFQAAPLTAHLGVLYMAIFSGVIAYQLYHVAQKTITATEANLVAYLQPVFTIPFAYMWLGESITGTFAIGALIIAGGVFLAESR